jgi:magnesium-protoporphyrin IX monomethyl ester (oxidative) cyclase
MGYLEYIDDHSFPLGLAYLAAMLRKNGLTVKILDCFGEDVFNLRSVENGWKEIGLSDERIIKNIDDFSPDLIGITVSFSCQYYCVLDLASLIKSVSPKVIIVVGGNHVSAVPEKIDCTFIDYLIVGEGEYTLLQLIESLNSGRLADDIPGVISKYASEYNFPKHIENLDDLPFPALDLLPLRKYWSSRKRWINMIATRGCPYDCNFCSIHTIMGRQVRMRSIENIVEEIKYWNRTYDIQEIYFEDDNLTTNKQWAKELFQKIAENNFGIRFFARNGVRADSVDKEVLTLMKAAGFQDFWIAPETGNQRTLDEIIGKNMKLEDCTRAVALAGEVGIEVNAFFIMGFPEESWADIEATIEYARFLKDLGCKAFWFSLAAPYPGTRFFKQCVERGFIPEDIDYRKLRTVDSLISNEYFTAAELKALREKVLNDLSPPRSSRTYRFIERLSLLTDPLLFLGKLCHKYKYFLLKKKLSNLL